MTHCPKVSGCIDDWPSLCTNAEAVPSLVEDMHLKKGKHFSFALEGFRIRMMNDLSW